MSETTKKTIRLIGALGGGPIESEVRKIQSLLEADAMERVSHQLRLLSSLGESEKLAARVLESDDETEVSASFTTKNGVSLDIFLDVVVTVRVNGQLLSDVDR